MLRVRPRGQIAARRPWRDRLDSRVACREGIRTRQQGGNALGTRRLAHRSFRGAVAAVLLLAVTGMTGCGGSGGGGHVTPWTVPIDGSRPTDPVLGDGAVYVAYELDGHQGRVIAMEADSGKVRWSASVPGVGSGTKPVLAGRTLVVNNTDAVYALNTATGEVRWKYEAGVYGGIGQPGVIGQTVVFGTAPGGLQAVDLATGKDKGTFGKGDSYDFPPIGHDGLIIAVGAESTGVVAFDATSFQERWRSKVDSEPQLPPSVMQDVLYVNTGSSGVYALDARTGSEKWHAKLHAESKEQPLVGNGSVFIGGGQSDKLYALDTVSGMVRWKVDVTGFAHDAAEIIAAGAGDTVYAGNGSRTLLVIDPDHGTVKGRIALSGEPVSGLAAAGNAVYVVLRPPTGTFQLTAIDGHAPATSQHPTNGAG
ncbi:PQQ-binding-like beta-propeller repeat protein [Yinghuangia seranimata]|uniref:outer membrane protein assembly factor BamB family protein n=1 Tax=Yinghuangia seranimata TaxID=408067 RepID=UPI00248B8FC2|nr:PQQ-binding-like beta-propeller repeat protein [Yinghuangia seranimata]MDI2130564.1 PQQ-binding-like beta-propeller repeat protein [Yinghuangia seranimata]